MPASSAGASDAAAPLFPTHETLASMAATSPLEAERHRSPAPPLQPQFLEKERSRAIVGAAISGKAGCVGHGAAAAAEASASQARSAMSACHVAEATETLEARRRKASEEVEKEDPWR